MGLFRKNIPMPDDYDEDGDYVGPASYADDDFTDTDDDVDLPPRKKKGKAGGIIIAVALAVAVLVALTSIISMIIGPTRRESKELLETFEEGCNTLDFYSLADCIDPHYRSLVKAALLVGDALSGDGLESVINTLDQVMGGTLSEAADGTSQTMQNVVKSIRIKPIKYGFPGKARVVKCKVSVGIFESYVKVTIKKKDREVYIARVVPAKS